MSHAADNAAPAPSPSDAVQTGRQALVLTGVTKRFGGVTAVEDLNLVAPAGSALAIIGPNGAGKSTALKLIAGTYKPTSGSIQLGASRIDRMKPHAVPRAGIALANQVPRPFRGLSVRDNVRLGSHVSRDSNAPGVDEVMELCDLSAKANRVVGDLALLDLKRLEIARSLATDPKILLLDEVAAGLVGRELDQAIELVRRINQSGRTVILVEHVEGVVRSLVDHVTVLDWGRVIATGTPDEVAANERVREVYLGSSAPAAEDTIRTPSRTSPQMPRATVEAAAQSAPALELKKITAGYGSVTALRGVTLDVRAGEVVAVLGANGAGKTTLCEISSGLSRPFAGSVLLGGADVTAKPAFQRTRAGLAHCREGRKLFGDLSVQENLDLGAPLTMRAAELGSRRDGVTAIFPILVEKAAARAGSLSGGQQQMVAIGRALMSQPSLLICDEVSLGLAPVAIDALYEGLDRVRAAGTAILLVEQSVERCLQFAERVYVLNRGQLSFSGPPSALADRVALDEAYFGQVDGGPAQAALTTGPLPLPSGSPPRS